jgi:hypothetical protein
MLNGMNSSRLIIEQYRSKEHNRYRKPLLFYSARGNQEIRAKTANF